MLKSCSATDLTVSSDDNFLYKWDVFVLTFHVTTAPGWRQLYCLFLVNEAYFHAFFFSMTGTLTIHLDI